MERFASLHQAVDRNVLTAGSLQRCKQLQARDRWQQPAKRIGSSRLQGPGSRQHTVSAAAPSSELRVQAQPDGASRHARPASRLPPPHKPEVLAPAGGWDQLRAAVENGADAVYFGLSDFNARARASNFDPEELPEVMTYLHDRGAKGYVVLNVLVFDEELPTVEQRVRQLALAGVDAVIVQDLGVVELIRRVAPGLPIHGSTQMSITSAEGAEFAHRRGVERIVVGRELSVREISLLSAGTGAEVEAFVHGALCVSYSGQCFSSEAWGGRSANRGQCAQACRLPYGLLVNGTLAELGDIQYLLSPQDLAAVDLIPELIDAGVSCFKIEGRLKGPEYVALTTQVYRRAVDAAWAARAPGTSDFSLTGGTADANANANASSRNAGADAGTASTSGRLQLGEQEWRDLQQVFARGQDGAFAGLTPGFLEGSQHQRLVRGRAPRHRGNLLGEVQRVGRQGVSLRLQQPVRRGDGVVFDQGNPQQQEQGGSVFSITDPGGQQLSEAPAGAVVTLGFGRGQVDLRQVSQGDLLWKNKDPGLEARLRSSYESLPAAATRRLPVTVSVSVAEGQALRITVTDAEGNSGSGSTECVAQPAGSRPLAEAGIRQAVGQHLGNEGALTAEAWDLSACQLTSGSGLFVPGGAIKEARRQAVAALLQARQQSKRRTARGLASGSVLPGMLEEVRQRGPASAPAASPSSSSSSSSTIDGSRPERSAAAAGAAGSLGEPRLRVLCRTAAQVEAALQLPFMEEIILDFLEVHGLKEACIAVRAAGRRLVVATPRVIKPEERRILLFFLRLGADALLLRSAGVLQQLMELGGPGAPVEGCEHAIPSLEGDFSLNAANALAADALLRTGLSRLAPTHDCNAAQLQRMAAALGSRAGQLEVILHQHLPIFHTEHCVFCRFLSSGQSYLDCGHPCEKNSVHLRDDKGKDHLVLADQGCRNTVFNASAQSGLPYLPGFLAAGVCTLRVELVDEPAQYVGPLLQGYQEAVQAARRQDFRFSPNSAFWRYMQQLPDANGRAHGAGLGSLETRAERSSASMKRTAYQR